MPRSRQRRYRTQPFSASLGVPVGKGNHLVELTFWPTGLTLGLTLAAGCLLALLVPWRRLRGAPG